MQETVKTSL